MQMKTATESRVIRFAAGDVPYTLKRSARRRTVALQIDSHGLTVSAPFRVSLRWIEGFMHEKSAWVLGQLDAMRCKVPDIVRWRDGMDLLFLGRQIRLAVLPWSRPITLKGNLLLVGVDDMTSGAKLERLVLAWYRRQAADHFRGRVAALAPGLDVVTPHVFLSDAQTRWGSCNGMGEIRLNWRLIQAHPEQVDYVVAHELAHLIELNHSRAFWRTVERIFPDHVRVRKALRLAARAYSRF
jgi:predicted metal-dependent hydrolase